jgi:hypothetical protein
VGLIHLVPTLATMAEIYRLPREGGAASPRFKRYLELVPRCYELVAYNPMAGTHALETLEQLLAINAEAVARRPPEKQPVCAAIGIRSRSRWSCARPVRGPTG